MVITRKLLVGVDDWKQALTVGYRTEISGDKVLIEVWTETMDVSGDLGQRQSKTKGSTDGRDITKLVEPSEDCSRVIIGDRQKMFLWNTKLFAEVIGNFKSLP